MQKLKVAFVETNCKKNGPIKQTLYIIQYMNREVFDPVLVTIWPEEEDNSMINEYKEINIPVFTANISKVKSIYEGKRVVKNILEDIKPDIVHSVGMPLYRMALGYNDTIHLLTLRNYCYEDYPDYYGKIIGFLMAYFDIKLIRRKMHLGERFVTCSKSLSKVYKDRQQLDIEYIRNGVDVDKYSRDEINYTNIRKKLKLPINKIIFIYSGNFIDRKNQKEAIKAFIKMKKRKDSILLLLGDGKDFDTIRNEFECNDDILFRGKVSNVNEYLNASDIYLSTSKSEGLPNGVLEAMACRLPLLLSDISQHIEVIEAAPKAGYTYTLGNVSELTFLMDQIVNEDLNNIGNEGYKAVMDNFTAPKMSKKYQDLYINIYQNES
ncbi:MAG: glycosyltransferase family 4 protein [Paenibacillaceae bacterium]|nr:glycosyltransferase family 4 protein [Paenibacillaceae bacterium]